jgi:hypothetical protein
MTRWERSTCLVTMGLAVLMGATSLRAQDRPPQAMSHVSEEQLSLACSPTLAFEAPVPSLIVTGGQDSFIHHAYGPGDLITINAGRENGIEVGQEFFVRRLQAGRLGISRTNPATVKTSGWVRVYAVDKTMSLVTVTHGCDVISVGDYLEPFVLPRMPVTDPNPPRPQRENYGHIMLGTDRRTVFGKDDFFVIDRGSDHGVTVGERVVIFRDKKQMEKSYNSVSTAIPSDIVPEFLFELGEAVVVDVKPEISTVKALGARDAFVTGDYVALRK